MLFQGLLRERGAAETFIMLPRLILLRVFMMAFVDKFYAQPGGFQSQPFPNQQMTPGQFGQQQPGQLFPQAPQFGQQQPPLGSQVGGPQQQGFLNGQGGGIPAGAGVKLVQDLMPFDRAGSTSELQWMEPYSSQIYCVGQPPVQELRFVCGTCNLVYNATTSSFQPINNNNNNFGMNTGGGLQQGSPQPQQQQQQLGMGFSSMFNNQQQQNQMDQTLSQYTKDLSAQAQYPAIKLLQMPISGEQWDKQRLQCIGFYPAGSGSIQQGTISSFERPNVTADALVSVIYVGKPQILDQLDRRPIFSAIGQPGRFFVPQNAMATLKCAVRANPPATQFEWRIGGSSNVVGRQQMLQVPGQNLVTAMSLSCRATNSGGQQPQQQQQINWQTSDEVVVEQLIGPLADNNFDSVMRSSIKDANTGKVSIGQRASLQCTAASSSRPFVLWLHQPSPGRILNATCDGGAQTTPEAPLPFPSGGQQQQQQGQGPQQIQQRPTMSLASVKSTCSITFDSFIEAGDYWCLACSYIAENATSCNIPNPNMAPAGAANFELQGPPYLSPYFKVDRFPNSKQVALIFTFCGDPLPKSKEIFFTLDDDRLDFNSHYKGGGIHSGAPVQNQTYSRCQDVQLSLDSSNAASKFRTLALNIEPADKLYAPIRQQYYIQDAVTNPGQSAYDGAPFDATALAIGLALGLVVLVLLILCAYCWYKKLCIFAPRRPKNKTTKMGNTTSNVGPGSKPARYQAGIPSSQLRPDVSHEKSVPLTRTNNGLERPSKTPHEGMTYSEFDLVKDSNRLVPSGNPRQVVEYSRMPQSTGINPASIKSPTNSIV